MGLNNGLKQWALNFRAYMSSGKMLQHNSMNNIIKSAGHNLHLDKPEIVMEIMESSLEKTSL